MNTEGFPTTMALLPKFGRFLLVGGVCTGLQYVLLILLIRTVNAEPTLASTLGYLVSALLNYLLSYSFTFRSAARHQESLPRFLLIGALGVALNATVVFVGVRTFGMHYLVAQIAATFTTLLWNFYANHRWTF